MCLSVNLFDCSQARRELKDASFKENKRGPNTHPLVVDFGLWTDWLEGLSLIVYNGKYTFLIAFKY